MVRGGAAEGTGEVEVEEIGEVAVQDSKGPPPPNPEVLSMPPSPTTLPIGFVTAIMSMEIKLSTASSPCPAPGCQESSNLLNEPVTNLKKRKKKKE